MLPGVSLCSCHSLPPRGRKGQQGSWSLTPSSSLHHFSSFNSVLPASLVGLGPKPLRAALSGEGISCVSRQLFLPSQSRSPTASTASGNTPGTTRNRIRDLQKVCDAMISKKPSLFSAFQHPRHQCSLYENIYSSVDADSISLSNLPRSKHYVAKGSDLILQKSSGKRHPFSRRVLRK